ncbi:hypothetical protein PHISP_05054 [Aspergillus sp. HF37]|nr:hypothetical protein PHISP_05054 [Aspergillus sp. HF37]
MIQLAILGREKAAAAENANLADWHTKPEVETLGEHDVVEEQNSVEESRVFGIMALRVAEEEEADNMLRVACMETRDAWRGC